jgi:hemerythrin
MSEVSPAAALVWSDDLVTGHAGMDATHQSFVAVANDLVAACDAELLPRLRSFEAHAQAHFGEEDALMRSTAYPSAGCHLDEHAAVLKSVAEVIALVAQGNFAIGRDLAEELVRWFPEHTHHMDKSLTAWLFNLTTGGAPLVLRRGKGIGAGKG